MCIYRHMYVYIYVCKLYIYLPIYPSTCLTIYLSIYLSVYLSICLSVYLSICLSIYLYLSLSISIYLYLSLSLSISIYLYLSLSIYLSIYPSIHLSIPFFCYARRAVGEEGMCPHLSDVRRQTLTNPKTISVWRQARCNVLPTAAVRWSKEHDPTCWWSGTSRWCPSSESLSWCK